MSHELVLNFDQWKLSSKNYNAKTGYGFFTKLPKILVAFNTSPHWFKLEIGILYLSTKSQYSNLTTTCHIKPKFLFLTKLLKHLLLEKIPYISFCDFKVM